MPDAVLVVAPDGLIIAANVRCEDVLGYASGELAGRPVDALVPAHARDRHAALRDAYVASPRARPMGAGLELRAQHRSGHLVPVEISLAPLVRDVSERHAALEALRQSDRHLRALFENALDAMLVADDDGRIVDVNPAACELVGLPHEELAGRLAWDAFGADPELGARAWEEFLAAGRGTGTWAIHRSDGEERLVESSSVANFIPGFHLSVGRDVTERKRLEEQLRQSQKLDAIGQLAGGLAHDFNNVLTAIIGYSDLLAEEVGPSESLAEIRLAVELESGLAPVEADRVQLQQVVLNLVVNAREAMPQGGLLTISTWNADEQLPDGTARPCVRLAVTDTGVGMDAATRERLFKPFFTTKAPGEGTGLGLATVYGIVTQTNGRIEVESAPGHGATFRICFPASDRTPAPPPAAAPGESRGGTETILLVKDEDAVRSLVHRLLSDLGYTVLEARTGREAIELAERTGAIHLVLTDTVMPEMSGPELVARLLEWRPGVRVVHMSGYADVAVGRFGEFPASARFLTKPFTAAGLAAAVRAALDEPASPAPPA